MPRLWDPDSGQYYSFDNSELSELMQSGQYEDATMELLRRKREEKRRIENPTAWDQFKSGLKSGVEQSFPVRAVKAIGGVLDQPIPGARKFGEGVAYGPDMPGPSGALTKGLRGLGRLKGTFEESLPEAIKAYRMDEDIPLARIEDYKEHEPSSVMERIGRAELALALKGTHPDTQTDVMAELPRHTGDVAEMPTIVDAAALALMPWSGGASASPWALRVNKAARTVDAIDAMMGVKDIAEGHPIMGGIRVLGGGAGAAFGRMDDLRKVANLDDLDELGELRRLADEQGLSESEIARLEQLEQATELDDTVQPVNARVETPDDHPLIQAYRRAKEDGSWHELNDDMETWESMSPEEASYLVSAEPGLRDFPFIEQLASRYDSQQLARRAVSMSDRPDQIMEQRIADHMSRLDEESKLLDEEMSALEQKYYDSTDKMTEEEYQRMDDIISRRRQIDQERQMAGGEAEPPGPDEDPIGAYPEHDFDPAKMSREELEQELMITEHEIENFQSSPNLSPDEQEILRGLIADRDEMQKQLRLPSQPQLQGNITDWQKQMDTMKGDFDSLNEEIKVLEKQRQAMLQELQTGVTPARAEQIHDLMREASERQAELAGQATDLRDRAQIIQDNIENYRASTPQVHPTGQTPPPPTLEVGARRMTNMMNAAMDRIRGRLQEIAPGYDWENVSVMEDPDLGVSGMFDAPGLGPRHEMTGGTVVTFNPQRMDQLQTILGPVPNPSLDSAGWAKWMREALEHELSHNQALHDFPAVDTGLDEAEIQFVRDVVEKLVKAQAGQGPHPTADELLRLDELNKKGQESLRTYYQDPETGGVAEVDPRGSEHTIEGQHIREQVSGYDRAFADFENMLKHDPQVVDTFNALEDNLRHMADTDSLRAEIHGMGQSPEQGLYPRQGPPVPDSGQAVADAAAAGKAITDAQTAAAEAPLVWKDWVAKNYPNGFGSKKRMAVVAEYGRYKKGFKTADGGKPPKPPKPPKKGRTPKPEKAEPEFDAVNLSAFRRIVGTSLANIKKSMPLVGKKMDDFLLMWEKFSSSDIANRKAWTKELQQHGREMGLDSEERVITALDEGLDAVEGQPLTPIEMEYYTKFRDALKRIADRATYADVLIGERKHYFPHFYRDTGWTPPERVPQTSRRYRDVVRKSAHLEKRREGRTGYIRSLDVLDNYFDESWRRISEAVNLGKQHEKLRKTMDLYTPPNPQTASHIEQAIKHIAQTAETKASARTFAKIRYIQGLTDLGLAGLYQPTQMVHTTAMSGVMESGKALVKLLTDRQFRLRQEYLATKSGALRPDIMLDTLGNTREMVPGLKGNFMWGVPTMDKFMRIHAFTVGQNLATAAAKGDADALKAVEAMGFDTSKNFTPESLGKWLSDRGQFKTGPAHKPVWAQSSEWGKFVWQYKNFAYHHGIFVKDLFSAAAKGNPKPLIRFMAGAGIAGEILGDIRGMIRGRDPFDDPYFEDMDDSEKLVYALFSKSRRIPVSDPILRYVQNFAMIGGFGVVQEIIGDRALGGTAAETFLGAAPANAAEAIDLTTQRGPAGAAEWGAHQVPVWGYDIGKQIRDATKKKRRRRGLGGPGGLGGLR